MYIFSSFCYKYMSVSAREGLYLIPLNQQNMYIYYVYIQCKRVLCKNGGSSLGDPLGIFGHDLGKPCLRT